MVTTCVVCLWYIRQRIVWQVTGRQWLITVQVQWVTTLACKHWTHIKCTTALLASSSQSSLHHHHHHQQHPSLNHCGFDRLPHRASTELLVTETVAAVVHIHFGNHVLERHLHTKPMGAICMEQETVSGSGISWAICKSAPRSRQITMPVPHRSVFYRPGAFPAAQPTASKHWGHKKGMFNVSLNVLVHFTVWGWDMDWTVCFMATRAIFVTCLFGAMLQLVTFIKINYSSHFFKKKCVLTSCWLEYDRCCICLIMLVFFMLSFFTIVSKCVVSYNFITLISLVRMVEHIIKLWTITTLSEKIPPPIIWCLFYTLIRHTEKYHHTISWNTELFTWSKLYDLPKLSNFEKQLFVMLFRAFNFRQPVSKEPLKVAVICIDTPFLSFWYWSLTILTMLASSPCLNKEQMQLTEMLCMLCCFTVFGTYISRFVNL